MGWLGFGDVELKAGKSFTPWDGLHVAASRCLSKSLVTADVVVPAQGRVGQTGSSKEQRWHSWVRRDRITSDP